MLRSRAQGAVSRRGTLVGQVFGLLGFSFLFTAAGAMVAPRFGPQVASVGAIGGLIVLLVLILVRSLPPVLRLGLFYLFSVLQGLVLGTVIRGYIAAGQGDIVVLAAGTTAGVVFALSVFAWTTKHDFTRFSGYLFIGLIGVLVAVIVGLFVQAPLFHVLVAAAIAIVFSGYTVVHMQQLRYGTGEPISLAIAIYIDMLNLFWAFLRLLSYFMGGRR